MSTLRPYQVDAIARVKKSMVAGHKRVCLVLPTGTGKTVVGTSMVSGAVAKGSRVLWLAHRTELVDQAWKTMHRAGIAAGAIGASVRSPINPNALVQVASIDTLIARDRVPPADIVFFDEAHHVEAATWNEFLRKNYPNAYVIGLTATPERGDGKPLALFDDLVLGVSIAEAVKLGALVHAEIVRPNARQGKGKIAKRPVDAYLQFANGEKAICFTNLVDAATKQAEEFNAAGVPAACIHGNMSASERGETLDKYSDGRIRVLCNVNILTEGWDDPATSCCILARSVGSMGLYLQMVGRVLRTYPGKNRATILDLHGVSHTFGHPEDEMEYHLDGEHGIVLKKEPVQKDRLCKVCSGPLEEDGFCVDCGMEWKPEGPTVTDAELKYAAMRAQPPDKFQSTLFKWAKEGRAKGYKPGWLFYKIKSVYGKEHPWSECARLMNERDADYESHQDGGVQDTAGGSLSQ